MMRSKSQLTGYRIDRQRVSCCIHFEGSEEEQVVVTVNLFILRSVEQVELKIE